MSTPLVSVIIVNWNGGEIFRRCLGSLSKITYPNWELIVVDNGSIDRSVKMAKELIKTTKLVKNKTNKGFALASNQGYKTAKGKYILLLNNDTEVTPDFLDKLVVKMEAELDIGVIQPKIYMSRKPGYLDNAGSFFTNIGFLEHWGFGRKDGNEFSKEKEIFSAKGACMLIRKSIVDDIGLFDPTYGSYFEESDFCWRVWLCGYKVIYYPNAVIHHRVGYTIRRLDVSNINFDYYKNRINSLIKNLGFLRLCFILPVHLAISKAIVLAFLFRGKPKNAWMIIKAIVWNLSNLSETLKKRMVIQNLRVVSDGEILSNLSRPVDFRKFFNDFKRVEKDINEKQVP